jgi:hypothetical protein
VNFSDEIITAQGHLFRADAKLHKLWLYLPEPHKAAVGELRTKLNVVLVSLEDIRADAKLRNLCLYLPQPKEEQDE